MIARAKEFQSEFCTVTFNQWENYSAAAWEEWIEQWVSYVKGDTTARPNRRPPL